MSYAVSKHHVVFQRHQLDAAHPRVTGDRARRHRGAAQRARKQRGRQMGRLGPQRHQLVELLTQGASLCRRELALFLHQQLDKVPIPAVGRDATRRGVRLRDQASLFKRNHVVANGCRRELGLVLVGDQIRRHRLGQRNVFLNDVAKDSLSTGCQLGHCGSLFVLSN